MRALNVNRQGLAFSHLEDYINPFHLQTFPFAGGTFEMVDTILIDLKALMVEREDCDAGTVEKLRAGVAQGKTQYRSLREAADALKKKVDANAGTATGKRWHLKLAIAQYFLGHLTDAIENFKQAEGA